MNAQHPDTRVRAVWPTPPEGCCYVEQSLKGGDYISTGYFHRGAVDNKGRGRSVENCRGVTSLFFDLDLLGLVDAARLARGQVLPDKAADRKKHLYQMPEDQRQAFLDLLLQDIGGILEAVMAAPPTLTICSGWGFHFHYAVAEPMRQEKAALQALHAAVVDECNRQAAEQAQTFHPPLTTYHKAYDRTHDVGARLARAPGSMNTKCDWRLQKVEVIAASDTLLTGDIIGRLRNQWQRQAQLTDNDKAQTKASPVPSRKRPRQAKSIDVDFRSQRMADGRSWQQLADALSPGERLRVICPFGGTSVGSGFFHREADGRARYYSAPQAVTYWNSYRPSSTPGLVDLERSPPKKDGTPGKVKNTVSNLQAMLTHDSAFNLWFDSFREREMDGHDPIDDGMWMRTVCHMEGAYQWTWRLGKELLFSAVEYVCKQHSRNPVQDYVLAQEWDGCPRIDRWLMEVCQTEDLPIYRTYARKWAVGLMARLFSPGCQLHTCMVLTAPQGWGKSSVWREWADWPGQAELFSDTRFNIKDKDSYIQLYSALIYEDAEMSGSSTADQETRKAFITSAVDRFRPPYGRKMRTFRRHTVITMTTNEVESVLRDRTGSRRYWVVQCSGESAGLAWLRKYRAQLLAEAYAAYSEGAEWWLTAEESALQRRANGVFQYADWFSQCAACAYNHNKGTQRNRFTVSEFAQAIDLNLSAQRFGLSLSSALTQAGFARYRSRGINFYYRDSDCTGSDTGLIHIASLTRTGFEQKAHTERTSNNV
ncbi:MAG: hypothetical protein CMI60_07370 [Parvibaculum sp.]|nr:hypothetical protein [Parvibaculum sp.]